MPQIFLAVISSFVFPDCLIKASPANSILSADKSELARNVVPTGNVFSLYSALIVKMPLISPSKAPASIYCGAFCTGWIFACSESAFSVLSCSAGCCSSEVFVLFVLSPAVSDTVFPAVPLAVSA
nr:hypothetical protein [uncultured Shuttleworthia sp.]